MSVVGTALVPWCQKANHRLVVHARSPTELLVNIIGIRLEGHILVVRYSTVELEKEVCAVHVVGHIQSLRREEPLWNVGVTVWPVRAAILVFKVTHDLV